MLLCVIYFEVFEKKSTDNYYAPFNLGAGSYLITSLYMSNLCTLFTGTIAKKEMHPYADPLCYRTHQPQTFFFH